MKAKYLRIVLSVVTIAMIAVALGFSVQGASAGTPQVAKAAQAADGGVISAADDHVNTAAVRPWTKAEMLAAKPYPMGKVDKTNAGVSSDVTLGPDGPAGSAPAALPGGAKASLSDEALGVQPLSLNPMGYGYPAPFTRFHVGSIASYSTFPFRTVGKLFFTQSGLNYVCSASVQGPKAILTAGHCVHKGNGLSNGWSYNMVFVPAYYNGSAPYGQWVIPNADLITFTDWYYHGAAGDMDHDWGGAWTYQTRNGYYLGGTVGYLGFAYNWSRVQSWWLLGYPQASPFNGAYMYACNSSYAYDSPFWSGGPAPITVGCDQTGGTSGGPWILKFGTSNYANSVNSHRSTVQPLSLAGPYADGTTYSSLVAVIRAK